VEFPLTDLLRLSFIPSLGSNRIRRLVNAFETPERMYRASMRELCGVDGFDATIARQVQQGFRDQKLIQKAEKQQERLERYDARVITLWDDGYPANLRTIYNPPLLLYVKGTLLPDDNRSVALVGTRTVSEYGRLAAERLAQELAARGITVISGMATGIDSHAHWGALRAGGRTIAVFGCGIDIVYPPENASLYKAILDNGAVLSEFGMGTRPSRGNFPARNRIISGLSLGTVIVEAGKKSGALITASAALEQNREVFAVPGNITSKRSEGTNRLIRDSAAKLVLTAEDILTELKPQLKYPGSAGAEQPPVKLSDDEERVFSLVGQEPATVDEMTKQSGMPPVQLFAPLLTLELKGLIRKLPGNKYVRL